MTANLRLHRSQRNVYSDTCERRHVFPILCCVLLVATAAIQTYGQTNYIGVIPPGAQVGTPAGSAFEGVNESVDLASGNVHVEIPLVAMKGRSDSNVDLRLLIDSGGWTLRSNFNAFAVNGQTQFGFNTPYYSPEPFPRTTPNPFAGGRLNIPYISSKLLITQYMPQANSVAEFTLATTDGTRHPFKNVINCAGGTPPSPNVEPCIGGVKTDGVSVDNSLISLHTPTGTRLTQDGTWIARLKDGTAYYFNERDDDVVYPYQVTTPNGNTISYSSGIRDSLGRSIGVSSSGTTQTITFKDSNGNDQNITATYTSDPAGGTPGKRTIHYCQADYSNGNPTTFISDVDTAFWGQTTWTLTLPTGGTYTLVYNGLGELTKITYPSGGYTRYEYSSLPYEYGEYEPAGWHCGADTRAITAKYVCTSSTSSCGTEDVTRYEYLSTDTTWVKIATNTVIRPDGSKTKIQFRGSIDKPPQEIKREIYDAPPPTGTGALLRTVETNYCSEFYPQCQSPAEGMDLPTDWYVTYNDLSPSKTYHRHVNYDQSNGTDNPILIIDYGFSSEVLRTVTNTWMVASQFTSEHILDRLHTTTISDAVTGTYTKTLGYDSRGNVTSQQESGTNFATATTSFIRDGYGNATTVVDPRSNPTTYDFTDSWSKASCAPPAAVAYPKSVTKGGLTTEYKYNSCTGTVAWQKDPNGQITTFDYDALGRTTRVVYPDGGETDTSYGDVAPASVTTYKKVERSNGTCPDSATCLTEVIRLDGLARPAQTELTDYPQGTVYRVTEYDSVGRVSKSYNPTRCNPPTSNCGESTWGYVTNSVYDGLDRLKRVTAQDGSVSTTSYDGLCTTVTDPTGRSRKSCSDLLGRLVNVWEDPSGLNYETKYAYDVFGNLLRVDQKGGTTDTSKWRTRLFTYDALGHLMSANNPESGFICYGTLSGSTCNSGGYDANGNLLKKTDARGTTTTYTYDVLNRLLTKAYSGGTAAATVGVEYAYDGKSPSSCTPPSISNPSNLKGRRSSMCDASGATSWSYDPMGRIWTIQRAVSQGSSSATIKYSYNLFGGVETITYPSGRQVWYEFQSDGRPHSVWKVDASGQTLKYVADALYSPDGQVASMTLGNASDCFAGIKGAFSYNSRLQPWHMLYTANTASTPSIGSNQCVNANGDLMHRMYDFGPAGTNNGNVGKITNCLNTDRGQNFTYDSLNRILSAWSDGPQWGEQYTIDAWGNLTNINELTGKANHEPLNAAPASPKNQLPDIGPIDPTTGTAYDVAGNQKGFYSAGGTPHYLAYDAENRIVSLDTTAVTYTYDGDGQRIVKNQGGSGTIYWPGAGSEILAESDFTGKLTAEYVFFNGKRIARTDNPTDPATASLRYYFSDHLGSTSMVADQSFSNILEDTDYYPYGGIAYSNGNGDTNHFKFSGKERDSETGLDYFEARHYVPTMGRFISPDPVGGHAEDPQTLNRYAYVRNNPLTLTDPTGLDFYLSCQHNDNNGSTCQQMQVGTDKNGKAQMAWVQGVTGVNGFTATQIGNDANGNLVDRTTGTGMYTADVTGSGVQLSNNGGATSATGVFLNKGVDLSGTNQVQSYDTVVRGGNLPGFLFTFQNSKLEAGQTAAGFFTAGGTALDVDRALQAAGFKYTMFFGWHFGSNEYRSPGAPSGHFIVDPTIREPILGVPQTRGTMHFGETNPKSDILKHAREVF